MNPAPPRARGQGGFVLPAVLAMLTILTLVFVTAAASLQGLTRTTRATLEAAETERAALTAEAHFAFVALTSPTALDSLRIGGKAASDGSDPGGYPLQLDERPYLWRPAGSAKTYMVAVQDGAGLVNLDRSRQDALLRLFALAGTTQLAAQTGADQLLDYLDKDEERRPYGAESADYARAGRSPPANAPIDEVSDAFGAMDWPRILDPGKWRRIMALVSADPQSSTFNLNTAPPAALQVVLNFTPTQIQAVMDRRRYGPITDLEQIQVPSDAAAISPPNGRYRFTVVDPSRLVSYREWIRATPGDAERPYWTTDEELGQAWPQWLAGLKLAHDAFPDPIYRPSGS